MHKQKARIFCLVATAVIASTALASTPKMRKETNAALTISWITDAVEKGQINYGTTTALGMTAYDSRGENTIDDTHHVTIAGADTAANTTYYYDIVSGTTTDNNLGQHYTLKTGAYIEPPPASNLAWGQVLKQDNSPAAGAIVYLKLKNADSLGSPGTSALASTLVRDNGYWSVELVNFRLNTLDGLFRYSTVDDQLEIQVEGAADGVGALTVYTNYDEPARTIKINPDKTPPAKITNLAVIDRQPTSIALFWTAPGDDGNTGQASKYDVRYSRTSISETNWSGASQASGESAPKSAGSSEQFTVRGLNPDTDYWLAIKTEDELPNISEISNVVSAKTLKATSLLSWVNEPNLIKDGLRTEIGTCGTNFVYQVKYTHSEGTPPQTGYPKIGLYILDGMTPLGTFSMLHISGSYPNGAIYSFSRMFQQTGRYTYQFDGGAVTGEAQLTLQEGPIVLAEIADLQVTNLTDAQFTLSWTTPGQEVEGQVNYGSTGASLNQSATDGRQDDTHQVTITGLTAFTPYYTDHTQSPVTTAPSVGTPTQRTDLIYGTIYQQGASLPKAGPPSSGAITYVQLADVDGSNSPGTSSRGSTLTNKDGQWAFELVNLRTSNLSKYFEYSTITDKLHIYINGASDGVASQIVSTNEDTPVCDLQFSKDNTAPGTVTNLRAQTAGPGSIRLIWTAPGDDLTIGTAACYHIRYAQATITPTNWGIITTDAGNPSTLYSAGQTQTLTISGLLPEHTYYFGLMTSDEVWNTSELSNIALGTTSALPTHPPTLGQDSLYPKIANIYTKFTYSAKYTDADSDPPASGEPILVVYQHGKVVATHSLSYTEGAYTTGATYSVSTLLPAGGTYTYEILLTEASGTSTKLSGQGPTVIGTYTKIRITDVSDTQFIVSWVSESRATARVNYGTTTDLGLWAFDNRLIDTHYVKVTDLNPQTVYYFDVLLTDSQRDDNEGAHYMVKTGPSIPSGPTLPDMAYGKVYEHPGVYGEGAIVYLQLKDKDGAGSPEISSEFSTLVDSGGNWSINLVRFRTRDNNRLFDYSPSENTFCIEVEGGVRGGWAGEISTANDNPAPTIVLYIPERSFDVYSYPNPAKDTNQLFFRYYLGEDARVKLDIYNLAGDWIESFEAQGKGGNANNEIKWDITDVASDIYLYRLEIMSGKTQGQAKVKKLVIIH